MVQRFFPEEFRKQIVKITRNLTQYLNIKSEFKEFSIGLRNHHYEKITFGSQLETKALTQSHLCAFQSITFTSAVRAVPAAIISSFNHCDTAT